MIKENLAYLIFETGYGSINTMENREIRVLEIDGIETAPASFQTSTNPYVPGENLVNIHYDTRIVSIEMTAPRGYRAQIQRQFAAGSAGRLTVNWGGCMRYIDYIVSDMQIVQQTIGNYLQIFITLRCPDVFFNDVNDFGENIADTVPLIIFPNLWYLEDDLMSDYKRFDSELTLENHGDVPIGLNFRIKVTNGMALNPVIYLSDDVYFKVFVEIHPGDILEISTVRREKYVRFNGENILNKIDMSSTFFEIMPGVHKIYYGAEDGTENMELYLHRRPQYWGV